MAGESLPACGVGPGKEACVWKRWEGQKGWAAKFLRKQRKSGFYENLADCLAAKVWGFVHWPARAGISLYQNNFV